MCFKYTTRFMFINKSNYCSLTQPCSWRHTAHFGCLPYLTNIFLESTIELIWKMCSVGVPQGTGWETLH